MIGVKTLSLGDDQFQLCIYTTGFSLCLSNFVPAEHRTPSLTVTIQMWGCLAVSGWRIQTNTSYKVPIKQCANTSLQEWHAFKLKLLAASDNIVYDIRGQLISVHYYICSMSMMLLLDLSLIATLYDDVALSSGSLGIYFTVAFIFIKK